MSQVPTDIPNEADASRTDDTEGLAQAVDQLVSEIDKTVRTFDPDAPESEDLDLSGIDIEVQGDFEEPPAPAENAAEALEEAVAPIVDGAIDDQIDELVEDVADAAASDDVQSESSFEAPPSIDDLDEALASAVGDDDDFDLDGDFEESSTIIDVPASEPAAQTAASEEPAAPPAPQIDVPTPDMAPAPTSAEPVADSTSTQDQAPLAAEATEPETAPEKPSKAKQAPSFSLATVARVVELPARALSAPLRAAPEAHRDTVGWIALNTLFLAVCVWLYVLLLR